MQQRLMVISTLVIDLYIFNLLAVFIASSVNSCQRPNQRFLKMDLATGVIKL